VRGKDLNLNNLGGDVCEAETKAIHKSTLFHNVYAVRQNMTLILLIPYSQGCKLLADRQNSYDCGSKQERTKILLQSANGPALGCVGDSRFIENFFATIREK